MGPSADLDSNGLEDQQAQLWLAALRNGGPAEKVTARRGLAAIFEARGMVAEAVDLLVTNAREGQRDADLFQTLSRLYRRLGDEYLAASAALEATRLSGHPPLMSSTTIGASPVGHADRVSTASEPTPPPPQGARPADVSPWRLPLRVAGWIAVLATTIAAAAVAAQNPISAVLYLLSAAALGVLLSGSGAPRQFVRLPDGPLGEGALLFVWLLALLVAGALLVRAPAPARQPETARPGLVATPTRAPAPTNSEQPAGTPTRSPTP